MPVFNNASGIEDVWILLVRHLIIKAGPEYSDNGFIARTFTERVVTVIVDFAGNALLFHMLVIEGDPTGLVVAFCFTEDLFCILFTDITL